MSASPDVATFKTALGRFVTGVTIVTTTTDGHAHAMTANAFTSVSLDPLLVLVCVDRSTRFRGAVAAAGTWAVSVLPAADAEVADWLATKGRPLVGQLDGVPHRDGPATGAPLLDRALATLECRTWATYPGGDHDIVVGEVLAVTAPTAVEAPLLYAAGRWAGLA